MFTVASICRRKNKGMLASVCKETIFFFPFFFSFRKSAVRDYLLGTLFMFSIVRPKKKKEPATPSTAPPEVASVSVFSTPPSTPVRPSSKKDPKTAIQGIGSSREAEVALYCSISNFSRFLFFLPQKRKKGP